MKNTSELTFSIAATGPDLNLRISLDDTEIFNGSVDPTRSFVLSHSVNDDDEVEHVLCFEMSGKLPAHTRVSESGEILEDRVITISDVAFDGIALGHFFNEVTEYHHDFNGSADAVVDQFFGTMGCNGRVELRFSTPIYLWLLENI